MTCWPGVLRGIPVRRIETEKNELPRRRTSGAARRWGGGPKPLIPPPRVERQRALSARASRQFHSAYSAPTVHQVSTHRSALDESEARSLR